jgi:hypothetical protein
VLEGAKGFDDPVGEDERAFSHGISELARPNGTCRSPLDGVSGFVRVFN